MRLRTLARQGLRPGERTGVLLTHRHSDHAGNAAFLQRHHGLKIYAHEADAAVLEGASARPRLLPTGKATAVTRLCALFENRLPAASLRVDRALVDGDTIAGLEVHSIPRHTAGSVFYRDERTSTLLSGDMLLAARPPLTWVQGLALPYPAYAEDLEQAHRSLVTFHRGGFAYDNRLAGHGRPIVGGARERVLRWLAPLSASRWCPPARPSSSPSRTSARRSPALTRRAHRRGCSTPSGSSG